jgi:carbon-monoxide dehydrogenase small subunit
VNGTEHDVLSPPLSTLLHVLREELLVTSPKAGCVQGGCGACTVHVDGDRVLACLTLAATVQGRAVTTVEGLADGDGLDRVQQAFVETGAVQCGFCTPGLIVATHDLLRRVPQPSDDEVREALSGNLCRCTGYAKIFDAVRLAAERA